jgi:mannobiose 2-epimerase
MNFINKFRNRKAKIHFVWVLWFLLFSITIGQDQVIEKKLTAEQMRRPEIATIAARLGQLRRNEARFGPKHPSLGSIKKQISDLENQLREITGNGSTIAQPGLEQAPSSPKREKSIDGVSDGTRSQAKSLKPTVPSQWGFEGWSTWPSTVGALIEISKKYSNYDEAYPWLGIPDLIAVGPMPGMGLMWGVQYEALEDVSHVYQWFDDPGCTRKEHYFELQGRVVSLYYPSSFDSTGVFWVIRQPPRQELSERDPPEGWLRADVLQFKADRFAPYGIGAQSFSTIGILKIRGDQTPNLVSTQQRGFFIVGDVQFTSQPVTAEKLCSAGEGIWGLDCKYLDANTLVARVLHERQSSSSRSALGIQSHGIDSLGRSLLVDHSGRVRRRKAESNRTETDGKWPPKTLSQLGWYSSLVDGAMIDSFKRVFPSESAEPSDLNASLISAAVGKQLNPLDGLTADFWISIPKNGFATRPQSGRRSYPDGTVLVQTIRQSDLANHTTEQVARKIETRVLFFADQEWFAMSYLWDSEQTDGNLVESGDQFTTIEMAAQAENQTWHAVKVSECFKVQQDGPIGESPWRIVQNASGNLPGGVRWDTNPLGSSDRGKKMVWSPILAVEGVGGNLDGAKSSGIESSEFDWGWFKQSLMEENIEPWYRASFRPSGFFCTELDETWTPKPNPTATLVSQTRQIYTMAIGYSISEDPKLLDAMKKGVRFLLDRFRDSKYGGFYYQVNEQGEVIDRGKDGYAHAFVIYALATAAKVSGEDTYATEALKCWELVRARMMESDGGLMWKASEDFSNPSRRSQNPNMHLFEGLLELYDATKDRGVYSDALRLLDFVVFQLRHETGVIPESYQSDWRSPVTIEQKPYIEMGHQVEWAFLISRAVELGFPRRYLKIGQELMDYAMMHGFDQESGGLYEKAGAGKGAWQQAEFLRSLIRYYSMHGRGDYFEAIVKTQSMVRKEFIDPQYGGWIESGKKEKGNHWKAASHEVAMYLEGIRVEKSMQSRRSKEAK